jgi:nucleotide-binding universal stress UspA family protein
MFKHVLVPVDFAASNRHALEIAVAIARPGQGKVTLLHVIELIKDTSFEEFSDFYGKLMKRAQTEMDGLLAPFGDGDVEISGEIVYGHRVREILDFARGHAIDLIVLDSHKVNPTDPTQGWGTISYKVGILSQCPVMLVK